MNLINRVNKIEDALSRTSFINEIDFDLMSEADLDSYIQREEKEILDQYTWIKTDKDKAEFRGILLDWYKQRNTPGNEKIFINRVKQIGETQWV